MLPQKTKNLAKNNYSVPGETQKFNTSYIQKESTYINNMTDLKKAVFTHLVTEFDRIIKQANEPNEDLSNILNDYEARLRSLHDKSPSLSTMQKTQQDINKYTQIGLSLEIDFIQDMYREKKITYEQYRRFYDNVLLMKVALEEF